MKKSEKFEYRADNNCFQPTVTTQGIKKTINIAVKNNQRVFTQETSNDSGGTQLNNWIKFHIYVPYLLQKAFVFSGIVIIINLKMLSILNTLKHTYAIWFYIDQLSATDVTILTSPKLVHTFGAA